MSTRRLSATLFALAIASTFALPTPADARGRRNYSAEWEREEREEERREERERARDDYQQHQQEQQERYLKHNAQRQDRSIRHSERQLDRVLDAWDGQDRVGPAAPAPPKKSGTCIYGDGDKVLYQPAGVVCSR